MAILDLQTLPHRRWRGTALRPFIAGLALLILLGLPALTALPAGDAPMDWHGNSAAARVHR
ncbi:hypothetical protein ACUXV3_03410 [Roseobacteraceae bacterium NS-SX3]